MSASATVSGEKIEVSIVGDDDFLANPGHFKVKLYQTVGNAKDYKRLNLDAQGAPTWPTLTEGSKFTILKSDLAAKSCEQLGEKYLCYFLLAIELGKIEQIHYSFAVSTKGDLTDLAIVQSMAANPSSPACAKSKADASKIVCEQNVVSELKWCKDAKCETPESEPSTAITKNQPFWLCQTVANPDFGDWVLSFKKAIVSSSTFTGELTLIDQNTSTPGKVIYQFLSSFSAESFKIQSISYLT